MVVRTEHVDAQVEAPGALVLEVGDVTGDVRRVAVALDDDPVLVVAEVGALEPPGAVLLEEVAGILQRLDGLLHRAGLEQRVLVEVDVEVDAELVQGALDVREHQVDADGAEDLLLLAHGQVQHVGALLLHRGGDVGDVGARVSVLGGGFALGGGDQRAGEPVDLGAVVVEVVLARDRRALGGQDPAQRVAHRGPAGSTEGGWGRWGSRKRTRG